MSLTTNELGFHLLGLHSTCTICSKTNVFQNFSETDHSLAFWSLQKTTHSSYLERETLKIL